MREYLTNIRFVLFLVILVVNLSGCGSIYQSGFVSVPVQGVSGLVEIGSDWIEINPSKPLIPYGTNQYIVFGYQNYDQKQAVIDETLETLILADGRKTKIEAFLYDENGESYRLQMSGGGGIYGGVLFSRKGEVKWSGEPNFSQADYSDVRFPNDRTYTKLKIRSEIPLKCEYIKWIGTNPK